MSSLSISTGLISGLDFDGLVKALALNQQRAIDKLNARVQEFEIKRSSVEVLETNLLALSSTVTILKGKVTYEQFSVSNSADQQLKITALKTAQPGNYEFQALQKAQAHQAMSRGFADADTQTIGAGSLTISQGGFLDQSTLLETLNDGSGVRRGNIRITDRSGASAVIDLSHAFSVDDVLTQINDNVDVAVSARVVDGRFVLEDTSGGSTSNLAVVDLNGGFAALDLGIRQSVASSTLTGEEVFAVSENFNLEQLNDGNIIRRLQGAADIRISLASQDTLDVNLDDALTIKDVIARINDHSSNNGKVTASLDEGRIVLVDSTSGSGTFQVEDINNAAVVRQLGLDAEAAGDTLTGNRLAAGMNSVLLRNLRGGQGLTERGEISLTDRTGQTATIDLSQAETLTDILEAINAATDTDTGDPLYLRAELNERGDGIVIKDTSGASDSNLIIADIADSTIAQDLNIAIDSAVSQVDSGGLALRYVNEATSLDNYAPGGSGIQPGLFRITDTAGNIGIISITTAATTVGDIIQRINANQSISVRAVLNETGDGFVLIDEAGGAETLRVEELGDTTAADLRLLGEVTTGSDGKQRITSRFVTQIQIDADDTLDDLVTKINESGGKINASTFNDGSTFNPVRLSLTNSATGRGGRLLIDDGGLGLNFNTITEAQDALLQVGGNAATSFLIRSTTNSFKQVIKGIDVDIRSVGTTAASVSITPNTESVFERIQSLVSTYNQFVDIGSELTRFDPATNQRGILQGEAIVQRASTRFSNLFSSRIGNVGDSVQSLAALGIRMGEGGKLTLDTDKLQNMLDTDLDAVKQFFTAETSGFGVRLEETLNSLTDRFEGMFTYEKNVLTDAIDRTNLRVEDLTILMENKKVRLLNQFVAMENVIGSMQSQQVALSSLKPISINPNSTS